MAVVVGRSVPLAFTAFFLGKTSTPKEQEEEEADKEVLPSLEDAEVSLPLDESELAAELASSFGFHAFPIPVSKRSFRVGRSPAIKRLCHLQSDRWFHHRTYFFGTLLFFPPSFLPTTTHSVKSRAFSGTMGWHHVK